MTTKILRIDASARASDSVTRALSDQIVDRYQSFGPTAVTERDLANPLPLLSEAWVAANFTPKDQRSADQSATLALSDSLVSEVRDADILLIGLPVYNFGVPAALKAWIDLIARVGETFRYSEAGPVGLLKGKRAIVTVASGGTEMGSDNDFATGYLRHVLGFIGISDVTFVAADRLSSDAAASLSAARASINSLPLAA